jgi:hypothetical protein
MTHGQTVRACAIQQVPVPEDQCIGEYAEDVSEDQLLDTLWETDPPAQVNLQRWVHASGAIDRALDSQGTGIRLYALVWQDFPTLAAVEAANAALHDKQWLEEAALSMHNPRPLDAPSLPTWQQRLHVQRECYGPEFLSKARRFLERIIRERQQQ